SADGSSIVLTVKTGSTATLADFQDAIKAITFSTTDTTTSTPRSVSVVVADDAGGSASATTTITVDNGVVVTPPVAPTIDLDANDSSGVTGNDYKTSLTVGHAGSVAIADIDVKIIDTDSPDLKSATISINGTHITGDALSAGTLPSTIVAAVSADGSSIVLTAKDGTVASQADFEAAIKAITFGTSSTDTTPRTINVVVNDGGLDSAPAITTVTMVANVAPAIDLDANDSSGATGNNYNTSLTVGHTGSVAIADTDLKIADSDSPDLKSATISIGGTHITGDTLAAGTLPSTIFASVSADGSSIVLTAKDGTVASQADFEAAIKAITFSTSSADTSARTINVVVNDGVVDSAPAVTTITIQGNVTPTLDLDANDSSGATGTGYNTSLTLGHTGSVAIADTDLKIADSDSPDLKSATVSIGGTHITGDALAAGTLPSTIVAAVSADGSSIVLTAKDGTVASQADFEAAIKAITFGTTSTDTSPRTINVVINDGIVDSTPAVTTISVSPNVVPTIDLDGNDSSGATGNNYTTSFTLGHTGAIAIADTDVKIADSDSPDLKSATISIGGTHITGDALSAGTLPSTISAAVSADGSSIVLTAKDGTVASQADFEAAIKAITFGTTS
ncbi:hypothetical protein, partial [Pseudomonas sp. SLFW]|uniref:beta strand repeat-containing protein n=1 Tax=Pseudomonas sp. SLFW TaxID=2683259 RepID=UPI001411CC94